MPSDADKRKRALVTGGARRLGAAFAVDLARRGFDLWLHYNTSEAEARTIAERIGALGRRARLVRADLAAPGGVEALVERLDEDPPQLVVHSASLWAEDTALTSDRDTWEDAHRLHGWTALALARALARWGAPGHLVTLLDARLRDRDPAHFSYGFAKRELAQLTRALALELAPGVRVNGLAPGLVLRADDLAPHQWNRLGREATPLGRTGTPRELLRALRFLVDSPYVTGQIVAVDGGRHLRGDLFGSL